MSMKACGKKTKLMATEFILIKMAHVMKACGRKIKGIIMELNIGQMELPTKDNGWMEKNTELVYLSGLTRAFIKEISLMTNLKVRELIIGLMVECLLGNGDRTKWMVVAFSNGLMEGFMMENTLMIKKKDMAFFIGQMVASMMAIGELGSKMDLASTQQPVKKLKKETGKNQNRVRGCLDQL